MTSIDLYTLAYGAAVLGGAPFYLAWDRRRGYRPVGFRDRMGLNLPPIPEKGMPRAWVHALSLGEVLSAEPLVRGLEKKGWTPWLSSTSRSGLAQAQKVVPDQPPWSLPLDLPLAVKKHLDHVQPDVFVLVETDLWPNMLAGLQAGGIPAVLVNGRISPRSLAGYSRVKKFMARMLGRFEWLGCQSEEDRSRLIRLGARPERTLVTGNLKFDRPVPETGPDVRRERLAEAGLPDRAWIVAGSTQAPEEKMLLEILTRLKTGPQNPGLVLAPRNRERFEAVWQEIRRHDLRACRWSGGDRPRDLDVFLLDTYGQLDRFYEIAAVAFVGKSMPGAGEGGGQNPFEPAVRFKPVVFGPRMHNFSQIADLLVQSGGGLQVTDASDLEQTLARLLANPDERRERGELGAAAVLAHRGALARNLDLIQRVRQPGMGK